MKETEDNANEWKNIPCSRTERINIIKISMLLKATYRFNEIPIKIATSFFYRTRTSVEPQETSNSQRNLAKEPTWRYHNARYKDIL